MVESWPLMNYPPNRPLSKEEIVVYLDDKDPDQVLQVYREADRGRKDESLQNCRYGIDYMVASLGGWFGVCPPCAESFGATGGDKYDWVELDGGDWLMKNIQDAWVVWICSSGLLNGSPL
jgi:hypothetical protein